MGANSIAPLLDIRGISIQFGGLRALSEISFSVEEGEIVSLIGPNGAGKTTLLRIISGELPPTDGIIEYKGTAIQGLPSHEVCKLGVGRTFQAAEVFPDLSVIDNVIAGGVTTSGIGWLSALNRWGRSRSIHHSLRQRAAEVLEFVGIADHAEIKASALPAGQQRLLGIARMMMTGARLMLLDEPGAGLNETEKADLVNVIERLARQKNTVVLVEHDMGVVGQLSDRIVVLDRGVLIAQGDPQVVKHEPRVLEAYLGKSGPVSLARSHAGSPKPGERILEVSGLTVRYGGVTALKKIDAHICSGEIVSLVGPNGAGKSSLVNAIAGFVPPVDGVILYKGEDLSTLKSPDMVARRGISLTPEGRELFPSLSVMDNLLLGHYAARISSGGFAGLIRQGLQSQTECRSRCERLFEFFPILYERRDQQAGTLSGGQAQMLAIARSLMSGPSILILDEPSLGLAPQIVDEILLRLCELRDDGLTILLIEQNARAALQIADRAYVLSTGEIVANGSASSILADNDIAQAYLGWDREEKAAKHSLRN